MAAAMLALKQRIETRLAWPRVARDTTRRALDQVHGSVGIAGRPQGFKRLLGYAGPALLISVGYMDPGNWATDLEGGSRFGYQLLWVLLLSNLIAVLLQSLSARLGIVSGKDLAQACRDHYRRPVAYGLWVLAELAIAACDLAEVLGTAIALNLLFQIPLAWGVVITGFDVLLLLALQRYGIRKLEAVTLTLVLTIGACFALELFLVKPDWHSAVAGLIPRLDAASLYVAIGILGATVMPHNLYLHSALVQTRKLGDTPAAKRDAIRYNFIDAAAALNLAFLINAAILIVAASAFFTRGIAVNDIGQAQHLLAPLLGTGLASTAFALALLCAGQSATVTGTLAGQIVMEGFMRIRLPPFFRRLLTRSLAIIPALLTIALYGDRGMLQLLVLSQVVLSIQLPFAVIPLIRFTSDKRLMGAFANRWAVNAAAWTVAAVIIALNAWLVAQSLSAWAGTAARGQIDFMPLAYTAAAGAVTLLAWLAFAPLKGHNVYQHR